MSAPRFPESAWRKSSFSGANSNCVEIAHTADVAAARDSKHPTGPRLILPATAWVAFVHTLTWR